MKTKTDILLQVRWTSRTDSDSAAVLQREANGDLKLLAFGDNAAKDYYDMEGDADNVLFFSRFKMKLHGDLRLHPSLKASCVAGRQRVGCSDYERFYHRMAAMVLRCLQWMCSLLVSST